MPPGKGFLPGQHVIEGYGSAGFRFGGMSHRGSILALPSGISAWPINDAAALREGDFDDVFDEAAALDYFFVGCGPVLVPVRPPIRMLFEERRISFDVMPTAAAARTYNVLVSEGRRVGAALVAVP